MRRAKLTVATTFPVFPPRGGGQQRVFGLYSALAAAGLDVEVVAFAAERERGGRREIAPGLREWRVPATPAFSAALAALQRRTGIPMGDLAVTLHHDLAPAFGEALSDSARDAAAVVASHPYAQPAIAAACDAPLIYESHNVEADLKAAMFERSGDAEELNARVREVEDACCSAADHVLVCAPEDGVRLGELYGLDARRVVMVPNGADPDAVPFSGPREREAHRRRLGLDQGFHALFLGSWHEPNLIAVRDIIAAAREAPDVRFLVLGSAGKPFARADAPANVDLCGEVDAGFVHSALAVADCALNPVRFGSGTNLKMLEYALAGVPLVSSTCGARGLGFEPGRHYLAAEPDRLPDALAALRAEDPAATAARSEAARRLVLERFSWRAVAAGWRRDPALSGLLEGVPAAG
jgi:glycosyltransferase involved in cell wall biosynthesis